MDAHDNDIYTHEPAGVVERYVAWSSGRQDEGMGYAAAWAKGQCSQPVAAVLYELHTMAEHALDKPRAFRQAKDWGYSAAAEYAASMGMRYRLDWGRQAARDGMLLALWPDGGRAEACLPTNEQRGEQFGVGRNRYGKVRARLRLETLSLVSEFEGFLRLGAI